MVEEKDEGHIGQFLQAYLQRPYYWSWGGLPLSNVTNKWPKKEDRLKKSSGRQKSVKIIRVNGMDAYNVVERNHKLYEESFFTENGLSDFGGKRSGVSSSSSSSSGGSNSSDYMIDRVTSVLPTSSTLDYQVDASRSKWNFSDSIDESTGSNILNGSKANEVYVHNRTIVLVTGDSLLPKFPNDTIDYGSCHNGSHWSNGTECETNYSSTVVSLENEDVLHLAAMVATAFVLGLIILATIIGNVFVIAAILLERNLQNVANYLILSLAVADLLVACLVMPLGAVYEVSKQWNLGPELCDMWTSSDVLCCTASILHLVAIALDRYWAVTNIDYIHQRTSRRIGFMILIIWGVAFLVCIAPMLGWKDAEWEERIYQNQTCLVSQDIGYQVFATLSSFYVPLLVILILYWRIFQTARKRIRRRTNQGVAGGAPPRNPAAGGVVAGAAGGSGGIAAAVVAVIGRPLPTISETTTAFTTVSSTNTSPERQPLGNGVEPDLPTADCISSYQQTLPYPMPTKTRVKEAADSKRERKAAKTLAIITGAFVMCWLPFFILAILLPVCKSCDFNPYMLSFFLWLGYFNSTLNPIIYTIFSPEFRHAFKRLLCGRKGSIRRRNVRHFGQRHFQ